MHFRIFALIASILVVSSFRSLRAEETTTLKTEYSESTLNGGKAINYKRWNTTRGGKVILTHEERDLLQNGKFSKIDTIVFHDGKKLLHFLTIERRRSCSYHPDGGCVVSQSDTNGDDRYDQVLITDAQGAIVDCFDIAADGKLNPISDAHLKKTQMTLKEFSEGMKNLDK